MRRSDSLNTFSCLSLYGLLTRFRTGALRASQVLKRFSPYMPRPLTPAESPASRLYRCFSCWLPALADCRPLLFHRYEAPQLQGRRVAPYGLHGSLCTLTLCCSPLGSFTTSTLSTGGWLFLSRQGLAPCKKRQAFLGAHDYAHGHVYGF